MPVTTMLAATASAISGSSRSQPVSATVATPAMTPTDRPDVGEEVAAVGLERDRAVAATGADQECDADDQVDE